MAPPNAKTANYCKSLNLSAGLGIKGGGGGGMSSKVGVGGGETVQNGGK